MGHYSDYYEQEATAKANKRKEELKENLKTARKHFEKIRGEMTEMWVGATEDERLFLDQAGFRLSEAEFWLQHMTKR